MAHINKADMSGCVNRTEAVRSAVTFPAGTAVPDVSTASLEAARPDTNTLVSLQACINKLEELFSGNCNCLTNTNCCQTCQSTGCQSQYCQACQACQTCQVCQGQCVQCNCNCNCNCACNNGG